MWDPRAAYDPQDFTIRQREKGERFLVLRNTECLSQIRSKHLMKREFFLWMQASNDNRTFLKLNDIWQNDVKIPDDLYS